MGLIAALAATGVVGFCYGGVIAATPAVIAKVHGMIIGPQLYGRVFTAWGLAGLAGPWLAGHMHDTTGTYGSAIWTAAAFSALAGAIAVVATPVAAAVSAKSGISAEQVKEPVATTQIAETKEKKKKKKTRYPSGKGS